MTKARYATTNKQFVGASFIKNILLSALCLLFIFGFVSFVSAQSSANCNPGGLNDPLCGLTLSQVVQNITAGIAVIVAPIATIMVIYGGFQMITAAGDPEKFGRGRKTLLYAAIGVVVTIIANQVVQIIQVIL
ncbi:MAG: pilin [Candidatus Liptonbacteria bacterium]|nr:pilin [Candidatus Liptonbacteria bacterium]